jgi:hypothetical protein
MAFEYKTTQVLLHCGNNNASGSGGLPAHGRVVGQPLRPPDDDYSWSLCGPPSIVPWTHNTYINKHTGPETHSHSGTEVLLVATWYRPCLASGPTYAPTSVPMEKPAVTTIMKASDLPRSPDLPVAESPEPKF